MTKGKCFDDAADCGFPNSMVSRHLLAAGLAWEAGRRKVPKRIDSPSMSASKSARRAMKAAKMGNQCSTWYRTRHARAYTSLATAEAKLIAKWSGIPMEPQESAMCLGCHATGAEAEDWEKDDTFFLRDGVQCEMCHGPGSEYKAVMTNREQAVLAGLRIPTKEDCLRCHAEKGSHRIALGPRNFDVDQAWQANRASHTQGLGIDEDRVSDSADHRGSFVYRSDGVRGVSRGSGDGVSVQSVARQSARTGVCRVEYAARRTKSRRRRGWMVILGRA